MLVLTRKVGEKIRIGDDIEIAVLRLWAGHVSIGIEAPKDVHIVRTELLTGEAAK
jgi:carbon storage regulator